MKITFLGTRGNLKVRAPAHYMHSSLLVSYYRTRLKIDCGADWLGRCEEGQPTAIFITHPHPDHIGGLKEGAACPVYATAETHQQMRRYPLSDRRTVLPNQPINLGRLTITVFPLVHSHLAPAVGYRLSAGRSTIFYVPDLVSITNPEAALTGVDYYIGDGATLVRSMVRQHDGLPFGHTPVIEQLKWCAQFSIPCMIITHCGTGLVTADQAKLERRLENLSLEYGVAIHVAHDGLTMRIP
jgi:phosphoribosyl 1,2-cyclic phosphodiesterase